MIIDNIKNINTIKLDLLKETLPRIKKIFTDHAKAMINWNGVDEIKKRDLGSYKFNSNLGYTGYDFWYQFSIGHISYYFTGEYNNTSKELEIIWIN